MNKKLVMVLGGAALIGGYLFLGRRADASTVDGGLGITGGDGAAGGGGALGRIPFNETLSVTTYPGGGSTPLPLGVPGVSPGSSPTAAPSTGKNTGRTFPVVGGSTSTPKPLGSTSAAPKPAATPKINPPALQPNPRPAPKPTPIAVRQAQGVYQLPPTPKGGVRRMLD